MSLPGFDQPFPDRAVESFARQLAVLDAIAFEALDEHLPRTRNSVEIESALAEVKEEIPRKFPAAKSLAAASLVAQGVNRRNRTLFFRAVKRSTGLDLINTDDPDARPPSLVIGQITATVTPGLPAMVRVNLNPGLFVDQFAEASTARISTLSAGVIEGTRDAIVREVVLGEGDPEELTERLLAKWKKDGVPSRIPTRRRTQAGLPVEVNVEAHASFIARDQIGTLQMELTRERQSQAGITKFVWRTRGDGRVRPEHAARNGKTFTWVDGADGEFPGGPPACRCRAQAVVDPKAITESLIRP